EKARWMKSTLADEAADRGVRIFGIAFTDNADFELIQTLASRTGGEYYRAYTAADIDGVFTKIRDRLSSLATSAQPARPVNIVIPATPEQTTPAEDTTAVALVLATGETASEAPTAAETSLPDASANSALPDAPANAALDESSLPVVALPQISLPGGGGEQPVVKLPEVSLTGGTPPASSTNSPDLTTDQATSPTPVAPPVVPADLADATQNPAQQPQTTEPDESKFYIALMVGAAAILLALASLIFVLMRRKPDAALADALMPKAFLNDIAGSTDKQSYEVGAKPIVVGRIKGPDSEAVDYVVIEQSTIGRRHALIEYKEHSFWVTDQNSLNGTFVNNGRTEAGVRLKHGDRIRFHKHEFEFLVLDMFETDRTMMSETVYADMSSPAFDDDDDDATLVRIVDDNDEPSAEDPTVTRE
ncbi:MAG: pSer/pThr/pTyr-binding forkhead associated (FHA) protein, partial [Gammaproteobacteria bacterium]